MACEQTEKMATAYTGGELGPEEALRYEQHLLQCAACTAEVASVIALDRSLRAMRTHFQPSAEFTARFLAQPGRRTAVPARGRWFSNFSLPVLSAFSAAALIVLALLSVFAWRQAQSGQLIAEISDIHAATLASPNPVDIVSTNRHVVKPWFEGKLPFAFNVPELANTGFSLDGGRLIYLRQQPGAELVLHYGLHRCSIFIFQDGPAFSRAISGIHKGPFHVEMRRQNGLIFFVIGDLDEDVIRRLGIAFAAAQ
jgi:anti-sigma factor RsiW